MSNKIIKSYGLLQHYHTVQQLIDLIPIPAVLIHRTGILIYVNKKFAELYLNTIEGMTDRNIQHFSESIALQVEHFFQSFEKGQCLKTAEVYVYGRYYQIMMHPLFDYANKIEAMYITKWDVSKIKQLQKQSHQSHRKYSEQILVDQMTGISNTYALDEYIKKNQRLLESFKKTICLIDVDHLARFNQQYGFVKTNSALYSLAQTLKGELNSESDIIFKLSGDRFLVILPEMNDHNAITVAERLKASIYALNFELDQGVDHRLTISLIIHLVDFHQMMTINQWIHLLGDQLCQYKTKGRNQCSFYQDHSLDQLRHMQ